MSEAAIMQTGELTTLAIRKLAAMIATGPYAAQGMRTKNHSLCFVVPASTKSALPEPLGAALPRGKGPVSAGTDEDTSMAN